MIKRVITCDICGAEIDMDKDSGAIGMGSSKIPSDMLIFNLQFCPKHGKIVLGRLEEEIKKQINYKNKKSELSELSK